MKKVFLALLVLISLHTRASVENKSDSLSNVQLEEVVTSPTWKNNFYQYGKPNKGTILHKTFL